MFADIYKTTENLLAATGSEINIPRTTERQKLRCNVAAKSPEEYFRIAIAIPFFDDFLDQLRSRFSDHKTTISCLLQSLLSKYCVKTEFKQQDLVNYSLYFDKYIEQENLLTEISLCKNRWANSMGELPDNALDALNITNKQFYYFPVFFPLLKF